MKKHDLVTGEKNQRDFLGVERDVYKIVDIFTKNHDICKLLVFDTPDALSKEWTDAQGADLLDKGYINVKPIFPEDDVVKNFIMISLDNFSPTENPAFMDYNVEINVFCYSENLDFKDKGITHLRDLYLSHLIVKELNKRKLTGIGTLEFAGANSIILGSDTKYSGRSLVFTNVQSLGRKEKEIINNTEDGFE